MKRLKIFNTELPDTGTHGFILPASYISQVNHNHSLIGLGNVLPPFLRPTLRQNMTTIAEYFPQQVAPEALAATVAMAKDLQGRAPRL